MLEFNTAIDKDIFVIELEGSLDSHSAADFRGWFNEKIAAGYRGFAIDCLCLEYISSAGITALIELQNALANHKGKMVLYQLSGETRQLLKFLQLDAKLNLAAEYDDAITALTGIKKVVHAESKPTEPATNTPLPSGVEVMVNVDEMLMEEGLEPEKKGLQPLHNGDPKPATASVQPPAAPPIQPAAEVPTKPVEVSTPKPAVQAATTATATESPEAHELNINKGAKRLITCPNCKNVLRVVVAGDYLCPACRYRFAYKGSAE